MLARHWMMRPPPAGTPPHSVRTSPPQADRSTNSSSRGRIGRSTSTGAGGRRCRGSGGCCGRTARCRRRAAAARGVQGLLARRRDFCLALFQAAQRRFAAGRHAGADFWIVGAARTADRGNLRAAWLLGAGGRRSRGSGSLGRRCGCGLSRLGRGSSRRRLRLGSCSRFRLRLRSRRSLRLGRGRRFYRAYRALTCSGKARHVFLQALQRRFAARRHARAMGDIIRAALRPDGAALRVGRGLRKCRHGNREHDCRHRRNNRRATCQRVDHLKKSLSLARPKAAASNRNE